MKIVDVIWRKPVSTYAISALWGIGGFGEFGEHSRLLPAKCHNWPVAALTARIEARYWLIIAISAYPHAFDALVREGSRRNIAMPFGVKKLECCGYPVVKKFWRYMFIHFDRMYERDRHTDRQTDRQTDTAWRHRPLLHKRQFSWPKYQYEKARQKLHFHYRCKRFV